MENTFFSIVIPVYNTEIYLNGCVNSVICQTFSDWELILVNDGSTDQSEYICREMCKRDERISLISYGFNKGVSHARNLGIEASNGQYLFFLDSDDLIYPSLLAEAKKQIDIAEAEMLVISQVRLSKEVTIQQFMDRTLLYEWRFLSADSMLACWFSFGLAEGSKFYKKSTLNEGKYDEHLRWGEDTLFDYNFLLKIHTGIAYTKAQAYYYRYRKGQAISDNSIEHLRSNLYVYNQIIDNELACGRKKNAYTLELRKIATIKYLYTKRTDIDNNSSYISEIKKLAMEEQKNPIFLELPMKYKLILYAVIAGIPLVPGE